MHDRECKANFTILWNLHFIIFRHTVPTVLIKQLLGLLYWQQQHPVRVRRTGTRGGGTVRNPLGGTAAQPGCQHPGALVTQP